MSKGMPAILKSAGKGEAMKAFELDRNLIEGHASLVRSFTNVGAPELYDARDTQHAETGFSQFALLPISASHQIAVALDRFSPEAALVPIAVRHADERSN